MREYPKDGIILCRDCGNKMAKAGMALSGRQKVQTWKCLKCGWKVYTQLESANKPQNLVN